MRRRLHPLPLDHAAPTVDSTEALVSADACVRLPGQRLEVGAGLVVLPLGHRQPRPSGRRSPSAAISAPTCGRSRPPLHQPRRRLGDVLRLVQPAGAARSSSRRARPRTACRGRWAGAHRRLDRAGRPGLRRQSSIWKNSPLKFDTPVVHSSCMIGTYSEHVFVALGGSAPRPARCPSACTRSAASRTRCSSRTGPARCCPSSPPSARRSAGGMVSTATEANSLIRRVTAAMPAIRVKDSEVLVPVARSARRSRAA